MKVLILTIIALLVVVVYSAPLESTPKEESPAVRVLRKSEDVAKDTKESLEGAESAYLGWPYVYPYVVHQPYVIVGK